MHENLKIIFKALTHPDNKLSLIPNWLSFSRIIGGISIPIMSLCGVPFVVLLSSLSFFALTDFLDGKLARYLCKGETEGGALLDAVSDKVFSVGLIVGILGVNPVFLINGALECAIASINFKARLNGLEPKSNRLGKIKTWPLFIGIVMAYFGASLDFDILLNISTALSLVTIPLEVVNIKEYKEAATPKEKILEHKENEKREENDYQDKISLDKTYDCPIIYKKHTLVKKLGKRHH